MANRYYNPNTKYGRRKARAQAQYNYDTGTPEYRNDINRIGCCVWSVIMVIAVIFGMLIYLAKGEAGLKSWLK